VIKIVLGLLIASMAFATTIESAQYDSASQSLSLGLYYQGGDKSHNYSLVWDDCQTVNGQQQIAARLIDSGWDDTGTQEIRQTVSFDLSGVKCKPAELTVFSDKNSRQTLWIE
jgi:hypothetical protein